MVRRLSCIRLLLAWSLAYLALSTCKKCPHQTNRPNIIVIMVDDLGWDDVSFHGSTQIPTPNIDELANEGVILNSHYVSPTGTQTRAAFITGKHPVNLGLQHGSIIGSKPYGLPLDEVILPQYLRPLGYATHGIGKWNLGFFKKEYTPIKRGFETFFGFYNDHEDYWDHTTHEEFWGLDLRRNGKIVTDETDHYATNMFTQETVNIIRNHDVSKPLFIYLAHQAVHTGNNEVPLQAPEELIAKFKHIQNKERRIYSAMVASMDESVGKVTKALKKKGIYNNTIIVFATDNGGAPYGMDKNWGCNYPLRGGKNTLWEGGVRGVSFIHSPLLVDTRRVSEELMHVADWLPTLYHAAGGDIRDIVTKLYGYNMWNTLSFSMPSPRKEVLHNIDPVTKNAAIRMGKYKLIVNQNMNFYSSWYQRISSRRDTDDDGDVLKIGVLNGAELMCTKLEKRDSTFDCDPSQSPCLYDIDRDPCEYDNLFSRKRERAAVIFKRLIELQRRGKPVLNPNREAAGNPKYFNGTWSPWQILESRDLVLRALQKIPTPKNTCYYGLKHESTVHKSTVHKSTVHKSTVQKSTAHKSAVHKSTVHKSAAHKSTAHKSTAHKSTVHKSTVHKSTAHKSTAHKSTAHKSTADKRHNSTAHKSAVHKSTAHKSTADKRHNSTAHKSTAHKSTVSESPKRSTIPAGDDHVKATRTFLDDLAHGFITGIKRSKRDG